MSNQFYIGVLQDCSLANGDSWKPFISGAFWLTCFCADAQLAFGISEEPAPFLQAPFQAPQNSFGDFLGQHSYGPGPHCANKVHTHKLNPVVVWIGLDLDLNPWFLRANGNPGAQQTTDSALTPF